VQLGVVVLAVTGFFVIILIMGTSFLVNARPASTPRARTAVVAAAVLITAAAALITAVVNDVCATAAAHTNAFSKKLAVVTAGVLRLDVGVRCSRR
jgi:hypothetical protein